MKLLYQFKNRLFLIYSMLFFCITILALLFFYKYTSSSIQYNSDNLLAQTSEKIVYKLDTITTAMDTSTLQVISNQQLQSILMESSEYEEENNFFNYFYKKDVINILSSINSPLISNPRIGIFDLNKNFICVGSLGMRERAFLEDFEKYDSLSKFNIEKNQRVIFPPHEDNWTDLRPTIVFSLVREFPYIYGKDLILGYVEVFQPYYVIEDAVSIATDHSIRATIIDDNNNIIYPYNELSSEEIEYYISLAENQTKKNVRPWDSQEEFVHIQHSDISGWTLLLTQDKNQYMGTLLAFRRLLIIYSIIFFVVFIIILFIVTKKVTIPITELCNSVESLTLNNPSIQLDEHLQTNEIIMLTNAFNHTIKRLNESMDQIITANKNQVQAHILAMQSQMNPHFLFNTLMGISGIAEETDNVRIVNICNKLASMLRYISSFKDSSVLLKEELDYTSNYLELMEIRYESFLDYELCVEETTLNIPITKLVLQPIVENCFSHGFKNICPPYKIKIDIFQSDSKLIISVKDNGEGFQNNKLYEFRSNIAKLQTISDISTYINHTEIGGLGLTSIYLRLALQYGMDTQISVINNDNNGCTVTIELPLNNNGN